MMALGVLAVGATGVIAIQKAAVVGNASAKSVATATNIAARWAERLRVDAMVWNAPTVPELAETRWLKASASDPSPPDPAQGPPVWVLPPVIVGKASPWADPLGADLIAANDPAAVAYCTHISYRQVTPKMVTAVVRVTWRRDWSSINCVDPGLYAAATDLGRYGAVYLTTGLMVQERQ